MDKRMREQLEAAGSKAGSTEEFLGSFLGLSPAEVGYLEMRLTLAASVRRLRVRSDRTQTQLAALMGSSQSRVAKMEAADPSVSIDLMVKAMLTLGATRQEVAQAIAAPLGRVSG